MLVLNCSIFECCGDNRGKLHLFQAQAHIVWILLFVEVFKDGDCLLDVVNSDLVLSQLCENRTYVDVAL